MNITCLHKNGYLRYFTIIATIGKIAGVVLIHHTTLYVRFIPRKPFVRRALISTRRTRIGLLRIEDRTNIILLHLVKKQQQ